MPDKYRMAILTARKIAVDNSQLTARTCSDDVICTTFAIREDHLQKAIRGTVGRNAVNHDIKQVIRELGIAIGLRPEWGVRNNIILFTITKSQLFVPKKLPNGSTMGFPLGGKGPKSASIKLPNLKTPFMGTGRTMTLGTVKKLKSKNFAEYVIPKGTPLGGATQMRLYDYIRRSM